MDPTPIEKAAVAIVDYHRQSVPVGDCSNERTVITAVDNDNAVRWRYLSAQPLTTFGLSILQQAKGLGITAINDPSEWHEIEITLERRDKLYIVRTWIRQDPGIKVSQPVVGPS